MTKYWSVYYNGCIIACIYGTGGLAIFPKEDKAQEFCTEMNAIARGYTVEAVRIVKAKREKK